MIKKLKISYVLLALLALSAIYWAIFLPSENSSQMSSAQVFAHGERFHSYSGWVPTIIWINGNQVRHHSPLLDGLRVMSRVVVEGEEADDSFAYSVGYIDLRKGQLRFDEFHTLDEPLIYTFERSGNVIHLTSLTSGFSDITYYLRGTPEEQAARALWQAERNSEN